MAKKKRKPRVPRTEARQLERRPAQLPRRWWLYGAAAAGVAGLVVVLVLTVFGGGGGGGGGEQTASGLPDTPDYHSLLVNQADPKQLVLGTHNGLYVSADGGRHWRFDELSGDDAMNLARPSGKTIWLAGHNVFKKSTDGGTTWSDVQPSGLPGLDIHGFAADPNDSNVLYAAVAGQGLYRSRDGGRTFSLASSQVGGNVFALAVLPDGRLLAGDAQQGLLESSDGGARWKRNLRAQLLGLAVNPSDPRRLVATGSGGIALSTDSGKSWRSVLDVSEGAGPVAWAPSNPQLAYAVGFNRVLYRSGDGGESWEPVA